MNEEKYKKAKELISEIERLKYHLQRYESFSNSGRNLYLIQSGVSDNGWKQYEFEIYLKNEYINLGKLFKTYIENLKADIENKEVILKNL